MRILHVAPSVSRAYGGPTYSLAGYSSAATAAGAEVTIAAPRPAANDVEWLSGVLPRTTLELFTGHGRNAFVASPALHRWLRRNGHAFDVIHVHGLLNSISSLSARSCVSKGRPVVIRPFGTLSRYTISHRRSALKQLYFSTLDRRTLRRVSAVHFTTDVELEESRGHGIDWGSRAFVIPPPASGSASPMPRMVRSTSNVVVIARLNPVKRLELLLDAWPLVLARVPNARLVIAGEGAPLYERSLRMRAAMNGSQITFAGGVQGLAKERLLSDADLFVLPSSHENFGIAVLEALGDGLPVVVTPEVQLASFVRAHELGLIAAASVPELAGAIVCALGDSALRARCRENGAKITAEHFSPALVGRQLLEMYRYAHAHPPS